MSSHNPIYVTQPHLPPLEEFIPYLEQIWENKRLTNSGPFHNQLEQALAEYLGVEHLALFANGTPGLAHRAAGVAHHRRGHHHALLLRRYRAYPALERDSAGVRGHRPAQAQPRPQPHRSRHHPAHHRHLAGACVG